ncbi:MAG TPA: hypothetical protein VHE80_01890 [Acidimicrobiales bacterium]|nr:hypothetical protein [Acidimicrobiales bacterium]
MAPVAVVTGSPDAFVTYARQQKGLRRPFRRVTVPLLAPEMGVVFIILIIYVLKVFDIVLVIAPEAVLDNANVIALEMWQTTFGARNEGLGSAVAVFLFLLVLPVMILNVRRFRAERG